MAAQTVGLLNPGEMGAALGRALSRCGIEVLWASAGRGDRTAARAAEARLTDVGSVAELAGRADVILSVCPPHAAMDVARSVAGFPGLFVDANAVSPATTRAIGAVIVEAGGRFVDGGIVGPAPRRRGTTRLFLAGAAAPDAAALFARTIVDTPVVSDQLGAASAVKLAYAAWTKGTVALLLAIRALARAEGVESDLLEEWRASQRDLLRRSERAAHAATERGWRWAGEMEEIAATFSAAGLPAGFHEAAAEIFRRVPRLEDGGAGALEKALEALRPL